MFLCTDLFRSTQYRANEGPNPPLTTVALMTQHYPADPEINSSFFNHPADALHTLNTVTAGSWGSMEKFFLAFDALSVSGHVLLKSDD